MPNSEILPGQPITAAKLNNITTGTTAPSQPYQIGALWGMSSDVRMATSTTAFTSLSGLLGGPPGAEYPITVGTRSFDSTNGYVWWPLTLNGPAVPSNKQASGAFYLRMAPANLSNTRLYIWGGSSPNPSNRVLDGIVSTAAVNKTVNWLLIVRFFISPAYSTSSGNRRLCTIGALYSIDDNVQTGTVVEMYYYTYFANYTSSFSSMSFGVGTMAADNSADFYFARYSIV